MHPLRPLHPCHGLHLRTCSGTHAHEQWGKTASGWATQEETAYPWGLCRALAAQLLLVLQDLGAVCTAPAFAQQEATIQSARAVSNHQGSRSAPPLAPEFKEVLQLPASAPLPPRSRPLSTPRQGYIASAPNNEDTSKSISVGVHWNLEEFIEKALEQGHPERVSNPLPEELAHALEKAAALTPYEIGMERTAELRRWIALANSLSQEEAELKGTLGERRGQILGKKRLLLFEQLIKDAGHTDTELPRDLARGFDLTGRLPASNYFGPKFRPAGIPCEALRGVADRARAVLLSSAKGTGQDDIPSKRLRKASCGGR